MNDDLVGIGGLLACKSTRVVKLGVTCLYRACNAKRYNHENYSCNFRHTAFYRFYFDKKTHLLTDFSIN